MCSAFVYLMFFNCLFDVYLKYENMFDIYWFTLKELLWKHL